MVTCSVTVIGKVDEMAARITVNHHVDIADNAAVYLFQTKTYNCFLAGVNVCSEKNTDTSWMMRTHGPSVLLSWKIIPACMCNSICLCADSVSGFTSLPWSSGMQFLILPVNTMTHCSTVRAILSLYQRADNRFYILKKFWLVHAQSLKKVAGW